MKTEGRHNVYNALAAIAVADAMGINLQTAAKAVCAFRGVRHRIETVCERDGRNIHRRPARAPTWDAAVKAVESMRRGHGDTARRQG